MSHFGQRSNVAQVGQRIGGRLGKQHARVGLDGCFPGFDIGLRHKGGFHTEAGHFRAQQLDGGAEHGLRADHMIARLERRQRDQQNGRHAGGCGNRALRTLHGRQSLFKAGDGGIASAAIGKTRFFVGKTACCGRCVGLHKATGHVQGFAMLAPLAALNRFTHGQSLRMQTFR